MSSYLQNVALVGASGNLGSKVLESLLEQGRHKLTVVTRSASGAEFPASVKVQKGDYQDEHFLEAAFAGQDIVVLMLGVGGLKDEERIVEAAARAGVKYIMPSEYGAPSNDPELVEMIPYMGSKPLIHEKITSLGMKYVVMVTHSWIDYGLPHGLFGIDVAGRKATLYTDSVAFTATSIAQSSVGIARLLQLPIETIESKFADGYCFISSFRLTQPQLFEAVLRATGTSEQDWHIERRAAKDLVDEGRKKVAAGELLHGSTDLLFGMQFHRGNFHSTLDNDMLGLEQEDVDKVVKAAVEAAAPTAAWTP